MTSILTQGVSVFDGTDWTTYTESDGLAYNDVWAIAIDESDDKWFGCELCGVSKFDGTDWTTYNEADGLANNDVWAVTIDGAEYIWFGTDGGVSRFNFGNNSSLNAPWMNLLLLD